jgi:hypothetical protein
MSFASDMKKWAEKTKQDHRSVYTTVIFQLNDFVIGETPVKLGQARGGWLAGVDSIPSGEGTPDLTGEATIAAANEIASSAYGSIYVLVNNVKHIRKLEYGSSDQAPDGMVRRGVRELKSKLSEAVA